MRSGLMAVFVALVSAWSALAAEFHVTPAGTPQGKGSPAKPWDLGTALVATEVVKPGDTVWLHAGTYRGGFTSRLAGKSGQPVVVRGWPGERVTIDTLPRDERDNSLFIALGADAVYRDFEVLCSHPQRSTKIAGPWPEDIRRGGVDGRADRVSFINLIVHDLEGGFGFWAEGEGGEISGCVIYNNGWRGPDRGHGHAIYAQNARGTKRLADNILFHQFGYGIHVYGSDKASLKGFDIVGNIAFDNGCLSKQGDFSPGIMVGGGSPAERITIRNNVCVGGGIRLGYPWGTISEDVVCEENYVERGLVVRDFRKATLTRNTVVSESSVVQLEGAGKLILGGHRWSDNDYFMTDGRWGECAIIEDGKSRGLTYAEWQKQTGQDAGSRFTKGAPAQLRVIVRPNAYEPGRANLAILNPAGLETIPVDLTGVLAKGQAYRIVSAKDYWGTALVSGVFNGDPIKIPMKPVTPPSPVGLPDAKTPVTEPQFAALVVLPEPAAPRDFSRWEKEISAIEVADSKNPPAKGEVLFIGSSTIKLWKTLAEDFPEHKIISRGFGGSEIRDSTHFADRLIFPHEPRRIFLRAGGNDLHAGRSPADVAADFAAFVKKVHEHLPKAEIFYIAVSPAPARWEEKDKNRELNELIRKQTQDKSLLGYVDAYDMTLTPAGEARPELFVADKLHFNAEGYKLLADCVRPHLPTAK